MPSPPSPPAASGALSVAIDGLRTLIANVPFFQTWTSSADAAAALVRVHTGEVGYRIEGIAVSSGSAVITTVRPHYLSDGDAIVIEGAATGAQGINIDGAHTLTAATASTMTFLTSLGDGTYTPDFSLVIPGGRPLAVVAEPGDGALRGSIIATGGTAVQAGTLEILLEADVTSTYKNDPAGAPIEARNAVGAFVQGLTETQGSGDLMVLNSVELSMLEFTDHGEQDDSTSRYERWRALIKVTWGLEG